MSQTPSQKGSKAQYKWTDADTKEVKNFFQALDANDDGKISKIEAEKLGGKGLNKFFMDCDADSDGNVTCDELLRFCEARAAEEYPALPIATMFKLLTARVEGKLSQEEMLKEFKTELKSS
mmetsp:Transcript_26889/g.37406  ORF Transcript_26889/g.37406 Transcript_26889/m.37406 type:complete len:121 (-) Transcript_26889:161-523(-)|eukprot:CAMPEP_0184503436 /NCGR_PEP_ID=MMETSP0113_2-20130426/51890_1 /TAXON_ID=91329 /ORGANISM="Norrisiella sphaerica, Strain BC52" /LENGTH=120 /DNA_ID=CAMNT_0026892931 /DNA_START=618 /DNA_END=980 /DNA_ORIENTATION=-